MRRSHAHTTQVFIYGTLKRGHLRADLLRGQVFVGEAWTEPRYRLLDLGPYPGLVEAARLGAGLAGVSVQGEVWAVDDACLAALDEVESVDEGLYERKPIELMQTPWIEGVVEAYFYRGPLKGASDCGNRWTKGKDAHGNAEG